jgi:hypothetical protein
MPVWRANQCAELDPEQQRYVDEVLARMRQRQAHRGGPELSEVGGGYGALLAVNPEVAWHLHDLGRVWKTAASRGTIPDLLREWGDVVVCTETRDAAILKAHIPDFVSQGGRLEAVRAILAGDDAALTDEERETAEYARQVVRGEVTDDAYGAVEARIGAAGAVEFTAFVTFLLGMSRFNQAAGSGSDATWDEVLDLVRQLEDGTRAIPDPAASIY